MKTIKTLTLGMIGSVLLLVSSNAYAATYYFSTSGSNTTGNGSISSPFYSLCGAWSTASCVTGASKISLAQIQINPGDQLLFKRGDEWVEREATWTINTVGAAGNPVTFGAYGDPSLPRPVFRGAKSAFEMGKDIWTNVAGTSIWYVDGITSWPGAVAQEDSAVNGPQLFGAFSLQGQTSATAWSGDHSMVRGTFFYDSTADRLYVWRTDNLKPDHTAGRDIFISYAPYDGTLRLVKVNRGNAGSSTDPKYVGGHYIFRDLHVKIAFNYGFSTSYPDTQYINCLSELNGMEGFLFDRRRFGAPIPGAKDGVMRNCVSRRNNLAQGVGIGQGITVEAENVWVYDSESYENGFAGIDFLDYAANTKTDGGGIVNSKFHHNGIQPTFMVSFDPNIYVDGGSNITIKDCQVWAAGIDPRGEKTRLRTNPGINIDLESSGFTAGKRPTNITIINNLSYGNSGPALQLGNLNGSQSAVQALSDIKVIGNTLGRDRGDNDIPGYFNPTPADSGIRAIKFSSISSGFVFKNNVVAATNTTRAPIMGDSSMFSAGKSRMDFNTNMYYCPSCNFNVTSPGFFATGSSASMSIDQFRNVTAVASVRQDETLPKTTITANPLLTNLTLAGFDAHLLSSSPAINIADVTVYPISLITALAGSTRTDGALDIPFNDLGFHYLTGSTPPPPPPSDTQAPTAPSGLASALSSTQISLAWTASIDNVGVTGYQILNGTVQVGNTATNSFIMTGVTGQSYSFTVKAFDAANNFSSPSNTVTLTVGGDPTPPTAPLNLAATLSGTQASLTWAASTDNVSVTGYQILNNGTAIGTSASTSFLHNGVAGATYNYTAKAFDAAGNYSSSSNLVNMVVPSTIVPAPTNLTASFVSGQVQLAWSASTGATGYNVFRNDVLLKSVGGASTFDNTVAAGSTYRYKVAAFDAAGVVSAFSNEVSTTTPSAVPDTQAPSIPNGVSAVYVSGQIQVTWNASTDNVGVALYRVTNTVANVVLGTPVTTNYTIASPTPGATYRMVVQACDAAGYCSWQSGASSVTVPMNTGSDTTSPTAPGGLNASLSGTTANLVWTASTDNVAVTGYQVFHDSALVGSTTSTSYGVTNLSQGATHYFTVKAFDAASNQSAASNTASVTLPAPDASAPSVPTGLAASLSGTTANLSWNASTDNVAVTGYQVFQGSTLKGTTTALTYAVAGLAQGQTHSFSVKAYDAANNISAASNIDSVTVPPAADTTPPTAPGGFAASLSGTTANLSWNNATDNVGVTGYQVFQGSTVLGTTTLRTYAVSGLSMGQSYSFTVKAFDAANNFSAASNTANVSVPDTQAPSAPPSLTSSLSGTTASLSWGASTDNVSVTGYRVYRGSTLLTTTTSRSYSASGLSTGLSYTFSVKAIDAAGNTSASSNNVTVNVPGPTTPTNLVVFFADPAANISWTTSTGATGYALYRDNVFLTNVTLASYVDSTVAAGQTYSYKVRAFDGAGWTSAFSNSMSVTVPQSGPAAPTGLRTTVTGKSVNLFWDASAGAASYNIYRNGGLVKNVTMLSNTEVPGRGTFTYNVQAVDSQGRTSPMSAPVTATVV